MRGTWSLVLVAGLCAVLLGCAPGQAMELSAWTLHRAGAEDVAIELPRHLDAWLPPGHTTYALRTRALIPDAWRGQSLTLAIPFLPAPAVLRVNGGEAAALERSLWPGKSAIGPQSFRVDRALTASGEIDLEIVVDRWSTRAAWVDTVPRLSATE